MNAEDIMARLMKPLGDRLKGMVSRGALGRVNDSTGVQEVQVTTLDDEHPDKAERLQPYGMTSNPPAGAQCLVVHPSGDRGQPIVVVADSAEHRIKNIEVGEVAWYAQFGQVLYFDKEGNVTLFAKKVARIEAEDVEIVASKSFKWDVNGYGQKWQYVGGQWKKDSWTIGEVAGETNPISAPEYEPSGVSKPGGGE